MKKAVLMMVLVTVCFAFIGINFINVSADPPPGKGKYKKLYPIDIPKTGQTTDYADGDDGYLQKGIDWPVPRFTDNGDGTVTDNMTGLIWLQNANCFGQQTWANALGSSNALANGQCDLSDGSLAGDWHMPNIRELLSLIDYAHYAPALPSGHPFIGVQTWAYSFYWSSTTAPESPSSTWLVTWINGGMDGSSKDLDHYVWPVRADN